MIEEFQPRITPDTASFPASHRPTEGPTHWVVFSQTSSRTSFVSSINALILFSGSVSTLAICRRAHVEKALLFAQAWRMWQVGVLVVYETTRALEHRLANHP